MENGFNGYPSGQGAGGGGGGGAGSTTTIDHLGADVDISGTNTWTDVLSHSLAAGTYAIDGKVTVGYVSGAVNFTARLYDGTNVLDAGEVQTVAGGVAVIPLTAKVTLGGTTTVKLQIFSASAGGGVGAKAAAPHGSTGNFATTLRTTTTS